MAKRKPRVSKRVQEVVRAKRPEWQKNPVPKSLFNSFLKVSETWEDEELYASFEKERIKYMGDAAEDRIESGRLTVCLSRMKSGTLNLDYSEKN